MNIQSIYKSISEEKSELKRRMNKIEHRFKLLEKTLKHIADIKQSRQQVGGKKIISQEKLFNELGI